MRRYRVWIALLSSILASAVPVALVSHYAPRLQQSRSPDRSGPIRTLWMDGIVTGLDFSPDGSQLASADSKGTIMIWDMASDKEVDRSEQGIPIISLRWSPAAPLLVIGMVTPYGDPDHVRLLSLPRFHLMHELTVPHTATSLAVSPTGRELATAYGGDFEGFDIWDTGSGKRLKEITGGASAVAFSHDGALLATGRRDSGWDGAVKLWNTSNWRVRKVMKGHRSPVLSVAFTPNDRRLLSGSYDGTARVWTVKSGRQYRRLTGHNHAVDNVVFADSGRLAVTASWVTLRMWDVEKKRIVLDHGRLWWPITGLAVSPDGKTVAVGWADGRIDLIPAPDLK